MIHGGGQAGPRTDVDYTLGPPELSIILSMRLSGAVRAVLDASRRSRAGAGA